LLYHVVSGKVMAADVVKLSSANTVEGKPVTIKVDGGKVFVNDAQSSSPTADFQRRHSRHRHGAFTPADAPATLPTTGGETPSSVWLLAGLALGLALVVGGVALRFSPVRLINRD